MKTLQKMQQLSADMQAALEAARRQAREEKQRVRLIAGWLRRPKGAR